MMLKRVAPIIMNHDQKLIIKGLATAITEFQEEPHHVTAWPDEGGKGPQGEIDAIIEGPRRKIAVEHTSVDTFENQRQDTVWFQKFRILEEDWKCRLFVHIRLCFPCHAIRRGMDGDAIVNRVRLWLSREIHRFPSGRSDHAIENVPFKIAVFNDLEREAGLRISRIDPVNYELHDRLMPQLRRKAKKLIQYKKKDYICLLILESEDFQLMNDSIMTEAVYKGIGDKGLWPVDVIWLAEVTGRRAIYRPIWPKWERGKIIELYSKSAHEKRSPCP